MTDSTLGGKLKARRLERGWTLQQLSDRTGVHTSHLGRIERGDRRPSGDVVRKIAEPLGFTETELLKLVGYLSPDETDDRLDRFRSTMKQEIAEVMTGLMERVDSL